MKWIKDNSSLVLLNVGHWTMAISLGMKNEDLLLTMFILGAGWMVAGIPTVVSKLSDT